MKSILLYANEDPGMASRLEVGLDVARAFDGHLTFLQVTPYDAYIMGDPFGGVYALPEAMAQIRATEAAHRERLEADLAHEGVSWDWLNFGGQPGQIVVDRSRLADLIIISLPSPDGRRDGALSLVGDVVLHARAPVLAVPQGARGCDLFGVALVAWNGSMEGSHALRFALPFLRKARAVHIVTVDEGDGEFPATDACQYLARHEIASELHERARGDRSVAEGIAGAAQELGAGYVVLGAYGHSRIREAILGGVTRDLLASSPLPLILGH